jgi:hypothetical protein
MEIAQDVTIKANFDFFNLGPLVTENSPEIALLREYVRNPEPAKLSSLKALGVIQNHLAAHNLITTRGRAVLASLLAGDNTYSGQINYGALGTSSTAVNNSDTQLGAEVYRKLFASHTTDGNNTAYVDFFYAATDTNGTYNEFASFIDGTASANTGRIFSHILTGGWVKTSLQSLFISAQYTLN